MTISSMGASWSHCVHYQIPADIAVKLATGMQGHALGGGAWAVEILIRPMVRSI